MRDFEKKIGLSLPLRHLFPFSTHSSKRKKVCRESEKKKWARERLKLEADYVVVDGTGGHYSFRTMTGPIDLWEMD